MPKFRRVYLKPLDCAASTRTFLSDRSIKIDRVFVDAVRKKRMPGKLH